MECPEALAPEREDDMNPEAMRLSKNNNHSPSSAALALGATAGWFLPENAQGGAKRYVSPGASQLRVLVHALVDPGEEISWEVFHDRAWDTFALCLGDRDSRRFAHPPQAPEQAVRIAGVLNKQRVIEHGLGRREADNVVMVDGGGR